MNIGQLNDINTMIRELSIVALVYIDMILRTFAARCETALTHYLSRQLNNKVHDRIVFTVLLL